VPAQVLSSLQIGVFFSSRKLCLLGITGAGPSPSTKNHVNRIFLLFSLEFYLSFSFFFVLPLAFSPCPAYAVT